MKLCYEQDDSANLLLQMKENMFVWCRPQQVSHHLSVKIDIVMQKWLIPINQESYCKCKISQNMYISSNIEPNLY